MVLQTVWMREMYEHLLFLTIVGFISYFLEKYLLSKGW